MKIDISKRYKTVSGKNVIIHEIVLKNSVGDSVTYPVKGNIIENGKQPVYCIWSLYGVYDVVWGNKNHLDLVEI